MTDKMLYIQQYYYLPKQKISGKTLYIMNVPPPAAGNHTIKQIVSEHNNEQKNIVGLNEYDRRIFIHETDKRAV